MPHPRRIVAHLFVCVHKTCRKQGADGVTKELKRAIRDNNLRSRVMLTETDCLDQCGRGPIVIVYPEGLWYKRVDKACARAIIEQQMSEGYAIKSHLFCRMNESAKKS